PRRSSHRRILVAMRRAGAAVLLLAVLALPRPALAHPQVFPFLSLALRLLFVPEGARDSVAIPLARVDALELGVGTSHLGGRYALIGAILGAGGGILVGNAVAVGDVPLVVYATAFGSLGAG